MLGFGPLGALALGELPGITGVALGAHLDLHLTVEAGAASGEIAGGSAVAPGALLPLTLTFVAGQASGEGQQPPVFVGVRPRRQDARAPGALVEFTVSLLPGSVTATVSAAARGSVLRFTTGIVAAGAATGFDGIAHDNDLLLLDAA